MALSPGTRLGPYEILSPLGAGGMGEVYRAKHLKLGRDVAIKVLPDEPASDPKLLERFEREARAASALNHPNIVTIHDIDEQDGVHYIAMELVEGRTLRARLGGARIPVAEMVAIGAQIAAGLARAHTAGIVHRDLKPGNLMITDDGLVKILDFGLAKLAATADAPSALSTVQEVTRAGEVLGTAPYMSPEQAAGRSVDFRSDQFSFGSILYEMATGRRAFEKDSSPQTLAAIIEAEPVPVGTLNDKMPASLVGLIERCLSKDPRGRYDSTGDLAKELERERGSAGPPTSAPSTRWVLAGGLVLFAAIAAVVTQWGASRSQDPQPLATPMFAVPLTSYPGSEEEPTFSPDGSQVAFSWDGEGQDNRDIYVKAIGSEQALRLTRDPARDGSPAWSPNGQRIAFLRARTDGGSEVRVVPPTGGPERQLASVAASTNEGVAWSADGRFLALFDEPPDGPSGLFLLDVEKGAKTRLTTALSEADSSDRHPAFSADGRSLAFVRNGSDLHVAAADGSAPASIGVGRHPAWAPGGSELVFSAVPLAGERGEMGPSSGFSGEYALWRLSVEGGTALQVSGPLNAFQVAVSAEANRLAYTQRTIVSDIWRVELRPPAGAPGATASPILSSTRNEGNPRFSPDGQRIAFTGARSGRHEIWVADADGKGALRVTSVGETGEAGSPRWSPDGGSIAFDFRAYGAEGVYSIHVVDTSGGAPRQITTAGSRDFVPSWSADGQWIYFGSNRSGEWQVWKVPSSGEDEGTARQVTRGGGFLPIESADGAYLYFSRRRSDRRHPGDAIWRVPAEGGEEEVVVESFDAATGNWDLTAEALYFVDRDESAEGAPWVVKRFGFDRRRTTVVARLPHEPVMGAPAFSVSPDGRFAIYWHFQQSSDLMLVENFR